MLTVLSKFSGVQTINRDIAAIPNRCIRVGEYFYYLWGTSNVTRWILLDENCSILDYTAFSVALLQWGWVAKRTPGIGFRRTIHFAKHSNILMGRKRMVQGQQQSWNDKNRMISGRVMELLQIKLIGGASQLQSLSRLSDTGSQARPSRHVTGRSGGSGQFGRYISPVVAVTVTAKLALSRGPCTSGYPSPRGGIRTAARPVHSPPIWYAY